MALDPKRLARVHRVRTLQLGLAQADEARAREQVASEQALAGRIAQLAAAVAPTRIEAGAMALAASAHYRERLQRSAEAANNRVRTAEQAAERTVAATQSAKRDQSAIEKLIERGQQALIEAELRALQDLPGTPRKNRHDPC
ncbi:hypothetical protein [uncultured Sphingomonas sp.]|uniref:hypothetical protein n=1 Tax=uncultured Sphingomonas sp. TaxID=158754 RepID=UPI0025CEB767|nr:hypothetical protein [uncultured Sphingomonas sp.]